MVTTLLVLQHCCVDIDDGDGGVDDGDVDDVMTAQKNIA